MEKNDGQGGLFVESPDLPKENNNGRHAMEKEKNSTTQAQQDLKRNLDKLLTAVWISFYNSTPQAQQDLKRTLEKVLLMLAGYKNSHPQAEQDIAPYIHAFDNFHLMLTKPQKHEETITCCFCGKKIRRIHGNNPWPVIDTDDINVRCCSKCDASIISPARQKLMDGETKGLK